MTPVAYRIRVLGGIRNRRVIGHFRRLERRRRRPGARQPACARFLFARRRVWYAAMRPSLPRAHSREAEHEAFPGAEAPHRRRVCRRDERTNLRERESRDRRGALRRPCRGRRGCRPGGRRRRAWVRDVVADGGRGAGARSDGSGAPPAGPQRRARRDRGAGTPASRSRRPGASTSPRARTASSITRGWRRRSTASISTSARPSPTRGASPSASAPGSAPGTIPFRSPAGSRDRPWRAATRWCSSPRKRRH